MARKSVVSFFVIWNNGTREDLGWGIYSHPKRTKLYKQCELLFNNNKIISYGYEKAN